MEQSGSTDDKLNFTAPQASQVADSSNYSANLKQSLSTGQNRFRRNKGAPGDIVAIKNQGAATALNFGAENSIGINVAASSTNGLGTDPTTFTNKFGSKNGSQVYNQNQTSSICGSSTSGTGSKPNRKLIS